MACGFHPLYAKKSDDSTSASQLLAGVKIDPVGGRMGQQFRENLEDALNPGKSISSVVPYRLSVTLTDNATAIDVDPNGLVARYNVYITSHYVLYDASGKQLTSGDLSHVSSYNNLTNEYFSTYVSEQDALTRGIVELSEMYRQRLGAYFAQASLPQTATPTP